MRTLVTGGAGFIGSQLVHLIAERGGETVVVDNLVNGRLENLEELPDGSFQFEQSDIRDFDRMQELMKGVDLVFHLAVLGVRHSIHSPHENHEVNATGTLNLLRAARNNDVKRFVNVSSSEVYGTARTVPMTEEHPTLPHTVYGASKLASECYTRAFYDTYGFPTTVVRPFNAYGPRCHHEGDSGEVIPKFMLRGMCGKPMIVFGDGTQTRDFTFVRDSARGILLAGKSDAAIGHTINIGNGTEICINDLANLIAEVIEKPCGADVPRQQGDAAIVHEAPRPGDVLRLYADSTKAKELLGFEPETGFREGLKMLKAWYESSGKSPEELLENEKVRNWE
ncbi:MAG: GDP-mannose 4,6-dehydratase [Planctomycetota bacterium]|nr:GDP-mannose 4,6-dehydratase [Planctomycetota bacterium]